MRKILLTALAATVLVPTVAAAQAITREEREEAWETLRETNADLFRRPAYVSPRGLPSPRVSSGAQLAPAFYGPSYRIEHFGSYNLPSPGADQHYIRYRNDVLLVNVRSGRVIRVIRDFFL